MKTKRETSSERLVIAFTENKSENISSSECQFLAFLMERLRYTT